MKRAYSIIHLKRVSPDTREIFGTATTPTTDRAGDIVVPAGAVFSLPLPLLWQHNVDQPIGSVTAADVTASGIEIRAQLAKVDQPGTLQDRLDEAWQSIQAGLVRGLSIGFAPLEYEPIKSGLRFTKWSWLELSAVTIPANSEANIETVKRFALDPHLARGSTGERVHKMLEDGLADGMFKELTPRSAMLAALTVGIMAKDSFIAQARRIETLERQLAEVLEHLTR